MKDILRKAVLSGIGFASLTKDKVEALAKDLSKDFDLSEEEGEKLVDSMKKRAEEEGAKLKELVQGEFEALKERVDFPSASRIKELEARVAQLEKIVEELKK